MSDKSELITQRYGKARVRVLRVVRNADGIHAVHEVTASVMLQGDFSAAYLSDDNGQVVATDTMKNTVHLLAREHLTEVIEDFALALGEHFLAKYAHVSGVEIELVSTPWARYGTQAGQPHPHAFVGAGAGQALHARGHDACLHGNQLRAARRAFAQVDQLGVQGLSAR